MDTFLREGAAPGSEESHLQDILRSGDPHYIAGHLDIDSLLEHFGEESFEYLAYEHRLADQLYFKNKGDISDVRSRRYVIPGMTENPAVNYEMCRSWIQRFCEANGLQLPSRFHSRNKQQLQGMFYGMLDTYGIKVEDIVPQKYF